MKIKSNFKKTIQREKANVYWEETTQWGTQISCEEKSDHVYEIMYQNENGHYIRINDKHECNILNIIKDLEMKGYKIKHVIEYTETKKLYMKIHNEKFLKN